MTGRALQSSMRHVDPKHVSLYLFFGVESRYLTVETNPMQGHFRHARTMSFMILLKLPNEFVGGIFGGLGFTKPEADEIRSRSLRERAVNRRPVFV